MKFLVFAVAALSIAAFNTAHAKETQTLYVGGDGKGTEYRITYNAHGAALRSSTDVIYLGSSCDAKSSKYGTGKWWWANGGWAVTFNNGIELVSAARAESPSITNGINCTN
ncbi:MAG: hypothetical protein Q4C68_06630 [Moraxella sp.]|nr:hypothetical protein [Moraxella sp.]